MTSKGNLVTRRRAVQTVGGTLIAGLAGCSGGGDGGGDGDGDGNDGGQATPTQTMSGGGETLTMLTSRTDPAEKEVLERYGKQYNDQTGNEIEYIYVSFSQAAQRVATMLRGGNPPDFIQANMGNVVAPLMPEDRLLPVTDLIEELPFEISDALIPSKGGEQFAIPWVRSEFYPVIRSDLAGDALPDDPFNTNYNNFSQLLASIDENGGEQTSGWGYSSAANTRGSQEGYHYLYSNGVEIFSGEAPDNIEVAIDKGQNKQRAVEALEWFLNDVDPHATRGNDWGWGEVQTAYAQETYGGLLYTFGRMVQASRRADNAEIIPNTVGLRMPVNNERPDGHLSRAVVDAFGIIKESTRDAAVEYIKGFFNSDAFWDLLHQAPLHSFPPNPDLIDTPEFQDNELVSERTDILDFTKQIIEEDLGFVPYLAEPGPGFNPAFAKMNNNGDIGRLFQRITVADMDPEEAINRTAQDIRSYI